MAKFKSNDKSKYVFLDVEVVEDLQDDTKRSWSEQQEPTILSEPWRKLYFTCLEIFPSCQSSFTSSSFQPHISVGTVSQQDKKRWLQSLQSDWQAIEFTVDALHIVTRNGFNTPTQIMYSIPLGIGRELFNKPSTPDPF